MKQRNLTENQTTVLTLCQQGYTVGQIAFRMSLQVTTIQAKLRALKKGLAKNAYILPPELQNGQIDIFTEDL